MRVIVIILIISVLIRRFIPAKGFFLTDSIEALTYFGKAREIELRDFTHERDVDLVYKQSEVNTEKVTEKRIEEGIDLSDIKAKKYNDVDTSYIYGNIDDSNEDLASVINRGMK